MAYGVGNIEQDFVVRGRVADRNNYSYCHIFLILMMVSIMLSKGTIFWLGMMFDETYLMALGIYNGGNCKYSFEEGGCLFTGLGSSVNPFEITRDYIRNSGYIKVDSDGRHIYYWSPAMRKTVKYLGSLSRQYDLDIYVIRELEGNCNGCLVEGVNTSDRWVSINYIKPVVLKSLDDIFFRGADGDFVVENMWFKRETVYYTPYIILSGVAWIGYMLLF